MSSIAPAFPVPAPSDGKTVVPGTAPVIATGGDSLLGRILARAWLAGDNAPAPVAPSPQAAVQHLSATRAAAPSAANLALHPQSSAATPATTPPALEAFLGAFASALAHDDATRPASHGTPSPALAVTSPAAAPSATAPTTVSAVAVTVAHQPTAAAGPAAAPAAPPHVDQQTIVDQVLRAMTIRTTDGHSEVRMRLVPEHLGDVSVKLVVSGGSVAASITAHTPEAQNALVTGQSQLARTLADAGLKLQSFTVALAGGAFAGTGDQSRHQAFARPASVRRIGAIDDGAAMSDDEELLAIPSFGPPASIVSRGIGALNYLV